MVNTILILWLLYALSAPTWCVVLGWATLTIELMLFILDTICNVMDLIARRMLAKNIRRQVEDEDIDDNVD